MPLSRRSLLKATLATGLGGAALARRARAASASDRRFIFVFNDGGWDQTRVFASAFDNGVVDMEPRAALATSGDLSWVSHPDRPSVDRFFDRFGDNALILNGFLVASVSHFRSKLIAMTGDQSGQRPDWPALIANAAADRYDLPQLVIGGASFPGDLAGVVARAGATGQLSGLLGGDIFGRSEIPINQPAADAEAAVDAWLATRLSQRLEGASSTAEAELLTALSRSSDAALRLKDWREELALDDVRTLSEAGEAALTALSLGLCRCVTLGHPLDYGGTNWDTHASNDSRQSTLFEALFQGLEGLLAGLAETADPDGAPLSDSTVVVVVSEMGRTPGLNAVGGKDHWPWCSALLVGPGITGGRVIGEFDQTYYGAPIDLGTGELDEGGTRLTAEHLGATLLTLADVDPEAELPGVAPLLGALR